MRVIAGEFKGKRLFSPNGERARPTTDKVKEAVFNILAPFLEDGFVVDGFSGSGGLGLEALSRGAKRVCFIDNSHESISLTKQNIRHCGMEEKSQVIFGDFQDSIKKIGQNADIIILDPPYFKGLLEGALQSICEADVLADDGVILCEHAKGQALPDEVSFESGDGVITLSKFKERRYGSISVTLYEKGTVSGDI